MTTRQEIERRIISKLTKLAVERGFVVEVQYDGDVLQEPTINPREVVEACTSVDVSTILIRHNGKPVAKYLVILGNDGYDCLADVALSNHSEYRSIVNEIDETISEYASQF